MGRIKGWTKIGGRGTLSNLWKNRRTVVKIDYSSFIAHTPYIVVIMEGESVKDIRYFATMKIAREFALSYMRSHPNG